MHFVKYLKLKCCQHATSIALIKKVFFKAGRIKKEQRKEKYQDLHA